ncbi:M23 family metallopeptidase [Rhodococcus sp. NPDC058514]|uniref:M23 family metallopeptidase n=1 Tax=unclassified Rhodococcus (in: high G+C Gram-positive bacteria) TaxID=192944 RepID=UPI003656398A
MSRHRAPFQSGASVPQQPVDEVATTVYSIPAGHAVETRYRTQVEPSRPSFDYAGDNASTQTYSNRMPDRYIGSASLGAPRATTYRSTSLDQPDTSFDPDLAAPARRGGAHRIPTPPTALKGRAAVIAVAAGAVVAAGQAGLDSPSSTDTAELNLASGDSASSTAATAEPQAAQFAADTATDPASQAPQVLNIAAPTDLSQFSNLLAKGQRFSEERAAREAAARRPLFALPAVGSFTSHYGARWGTLHAGVDIANAIGTPIYAVADGVVIDSGPAQGFGMWVRLRHADGTVTVYGHIDSSNVSIGQQVMAGDQIARMGNRGFSTGPHLHFEVHLGGNDKIDPLPWLATRGISLGVERD